MTNFTKTTAAELAAQWAAHLAELARDAADAAFDLMVAAEMERDAEDARLEKLADARWEDFKAEQGADFWAAADEARLAAEGEEDARLCAEFAA